MKIELLRRREPFERLFVETVEAALPAIRGGTCRLRWIARPRRPGSEHWLCNDQLNAIHAVDASIRVRRAIRCHYGHHERPLRALAQRAYARLAASRAGQGTVAAAWLALQPRPEGAADLLFRGGGRRIRLLDYRRGQVWILPKPGVAPRLLTAEAALRRGLPSYVPAPAIRELDAEGRWLAEDLLPGVPLDQVADPAERDRAWNQVAAVAGRWLVAEARRVAVADYLADLGAALPPVAAPILERVAALAEGLGDSVLLGPSHGDLTGDNVLWHRGEVAITDWELAGERHRGYTLLDAEVGGRAPGFAARLLAWIERPDTGERGHLLLGSPETDPRTEPRWRRLAALLYLAERLGVDATTALSRHQPSPGPELAALVGEGGRFLDSLSRSAP